MKRLLQLAFSLLLAAPAFGQNHYTATPSETLSPSDSIAQTKAHTYWTLKNTAYVSTTGTAVSTPAFSAALTNPSIIVVGVRTTTNATVPTPTDTAGNTYVDSGYGYADLSIRDVQLFYAENTHTTASNVVTVSYGSSTGVIIEAAEFTGGATSSPVDKYSGTGNLSTGTGGGQNVSAPAVTTTRNGELIVGMGACYNHPALPGAGFDSPFTANVPALEYMTQTAAGSVQATWASDVYNNDTCGAIMMTLELAPVAYTASPSETNTASDSVARLGTFERGPSESLSPSDSMARMWHTSASPSETLSPSDSVVEQAAHLAGMAETNVANDSLARRAAYWRGDAISISWTPPSGASGNSAYAYNIYRGTTSGGETGPINASPVDAGCTGPSVCTYIDYGPQAGVEYYYEVTAVYGGSESAVSNETGTVIAADMILEASTASDALGRVGGFVRSAGEANPASDTLARLGTFSRQATEADAVSDSVARLGGFVRGPVETSTAADWVARELIFQRTLAETLLESDALSGAWAKYLGQPSHQGSVPGRTKSGSVPGRTKSGGVTPH